MDGLQRKIQFFIDDLGVALFIEAPIYGVMLDSQSLAGHCERSTIPVKAPDPWRATSRGCSDFIFTTLDPNMK